MLHSHMTAKALLTLDQKFLLLSPFKVRLHMTCFMPIHSKSRSHSSCLFLSYFHSLLIISLIFRLIYLLVYCPHLAYDYIIMLLKFLFVAINIIQYVYILTMDYYWSTSPNSLMYRWYILYLRSMRFESLSLSCNTLTVVQIEQNKGSGSKPEWRWKSKWKWLW
jgi:hypothetical protein